MDAQSVLVSLRALLKADPETASGFVLASIYCRAIRTGEDPRDIADNLFRALPGSDAWPAMRDALLEALET